MSNHTSEIDLAIFDPVWEIAKGTATQFKAKKGPDVAC